MAKLLQVSGGCNESTLACVESALDLLTESTSIFIKTTCVETTFYRKDQTPIRLGVVKKLISNFLY